MKPRINMIGIITTKFDEMKKFYRDVLNFEPLLEMDNFVEFKNEGVRLAISTASVMAQATGEQEYLKSKQGHSLELAFRSDSPVAVDKDFKNIIDKGAKAIKSPADMPWGQRTAFFADPDGNIHEIFADL